MHKNREKNFTVRKLVLAMESIFKNKKLHMTLKIMCSFLIYCG